MDKLADKFPGLASRTGAVVWCGKNPYSLTRGDMRLIELDQGARAKGYHLVMSSRSTCNENVGAEPKPRGYKY